MSTTTLPYLRENLQVLPGSPDEDGAPRWLLFDAVANRYFSVSRIVLDLIQHWKPGTEPEAFAQHLSEKGFAIEREEVGAFVDFAVANHLVEARGAEARERIHHEYLASKLVWWRWLLRNYLFIRIPLFRPDTWLTLWTPRLGWLFSPWVHRTVLGLGLVGGLMVMRNWDRFQTTFLHFFNLEGLIWYGIALAAVKSAHELGHAFVAKRQGCRVASMGVAFLVMFPVLYTDTTDAWRLRSRYARLRIVTAGVRTELYIAMLATFLWTVLPDGTLRSVAFFLATTSWLGSLLVNISPFLRFDGYYALSDYLGVENLQQRSFALGRWQLRKTLFGLNDPVPEPLSRERARLLIGYAWATWIYRFFLFLGIALLVYHFFFKVLGIFLFAVEIAWFVLMPIARETKEWVKRKGDFHFNAPRQGLLALMIGLLVWAILPMRTDVHVPAVLQASQVQTLFAPEDAYVESIQVRDGDAVGSGQALVRLRAPALELAQLELDQELRVSRLHLARIASSVQDKAIVDITQNQIRQMEQRKTGLDERITRFTLAAPFTGAISGIEKLHPGRWVNTSMPLLTVVGPSVSHLRGLVEENGLEALRVGQTGVFVPDRTDGPSWPVIVNRIDIGGVFELPFEELGSVHGGHVPVRAGKDNRLTPEGAQFTVSFAVHPSALVTAERREAGVVVVEGVRRSWLLSQLRRVSAILIRESGF